MALKLRTVLIDLSRERVEEIDGVLGEELFLGGKGVAVYAVYKEVKGRPVDAFSEENALAVAPGALVCRAPFFNRCCFAAVSPLTSLIHDSYVGGMLAARLAMAGVGLLVVKGKAREPVAIRVASDGVEIVDASSAWGLTTRETVQYFRSKYGVRASVAAIGPAGENLVRYASIIIDGYRAAGRGGLGAVMGSKNLKAIVASAAKPVFTDSFRTLYLELHDVIMKRSEKWARRGTNDGLLTSASTGMAPGLSYNYTRLPLELARRLSYEAIEPFLLWKEKDCFTCPLRCGAYVDTVYGPVKQEYEALAMLGACLGVFDARAVSRLKRVADDLGLDVISFGSTLSLLFEAASKGLVKSVKCGYGDPDAVEKYMRMTAARDGIGAFLAEGAARLSAMLGLEDLAVHVKGLEEPAWDPHGNKWMALTYATADVGASHLRGWPSKDAATIEEAVESLIESRDLKSARDHLGLCDFIELGLEELASIASKALGVEVTVDDLRKISARTEALQRIYALRAGAREDSFPAKWFRRSATGEPPCFSSPEELLEAVKAYYRARGWSLDRGEPLPSTIEELGLKDVV